MGRGRPILRSIGQVQPSRVSYNSRRDILSRLRSVGMGSDLRFAMLHVGRLRLLIPVTRIGVLSVLGRLRLGCLCLLRVVGILLVGALVWVIGGLGLLVLGSSVSNRRTNTNIGLLRLLRSVVVCRRVIWGCLDLAIVAVPIAAAAVVVAIVTAISTAAAVGLDIVIAAIIALSLVVEPVNQIVKIACLMVGAMGVLVDHDGD